MQAAQQIKRSVNKRYKRLEIEIDGVFGRLLLLKKKKYAGVKVADWGSRKFEREVKGVDIVRRDWCGLAKELGEAVLSRVLESKDGKEAAVHWIHDFLTEKTREIDERQVPLHKFVITKGLTKAPKDYPDAKHQPHVQVALRMIDRGKSVTSRQEIEYIICEGDGGKHSFADRAKHPHEFQMDPSLKVDIEWYKAHQLHPVISRMLSCVEGTDAARLAECFGMDGGRFAKKEAPGAAADAEGSRDVTAALDRKTRWKSHTTQLPGVACPVCKKLATWEALLRPAADFDSSGIMTLFKCADPSCGAPINPTVARNCLTMQFRQLLREYSEGWVQCGDDDFGGVATKTRRKKCGPSEVNERRVHQELEYLEYLCEGTEAYTGTKDSRSCRDAANGMQSMTRHLLLQNGYNWVDPKYFTNIFAAAK
jgi:DNA polymerase alpha subunit A